MTRKLTCLAGLVVALGMALGPAFAMFPVADLGRVGYQAELQYGSLTSGAGGAPGIGMSDYLIRSSSHADIEFFGNYLIVRGRYTDLTGSILPEVATGIHVHHDPALYHLNTRIGAVAHTGGADGTFEGAVYLTPEQQTMLAEGRLYLDIHTHALPQGELHGWIVAVEPPPTAARR